MITRSLLAALTLLTACGGGDDDGSTALEGIYELDSWTSTTDTCNETGQPAFEETLYSHFFIRHDEFFGETYIPAVFCEMIDGCRSDAAETDTLFLTEFSFEEGNDADGWTGFRSILDSDTCSGMFYELLLTGDPGQNAVIERQVKSVTDVPKDAEGECDDAAAREQAADATCERRDLVIGSFAESI